MAELERDPSLRTPKPRVSAQLSPQKSSGEGNGNSNPLQYSCLENPRDGGAWWAAVCGVAQSRTRLKRLSSSSSSRKADSAETWKVGWELRQQFK